jgi:hypothetical protein
MTLGLSVSHKESESVKKVAATKASSRRKSRSQHYSMLHLPAESLNFKIPVLSIPAATVMMTMLNAYFVSIFLEDKFWEQWFQYVLYKTCGPCDF